jgi:hypothetical protein
MALLALLAKFIQNDQKRVSLIGISAFSHDIGNSLNFNNIGKNAI